MQITFIKSCNMVHVLYNALHLTGSFSGVQHTEEQLMREACRHPFPDIAFKAVCPKDYQPGLPVLPDGIVRTAVDSSKRWQRIVFEHFRIQQYFEQEKGDILHCPAYVLPWNWRGLSVVTVHDTIALDYPEYCSISNRAYFRFALPYSIRHASKIIAVSETVKNDILRRFDICPEKIEVIYHGIDDAFRQTFNFEKLAEVRRKYNLPEEFILFVGNIEPKKNLGRLMDACQQLCRNADIPHSLVIAGQLAWKCRDVLQWKNKLKNTKILFPGYIDASDLPAVYRLAGLFVFPSLYEGFGIPPLEAMACGVPVIVSNAGALPEITGKCACYVDPLSVESIVSTIYRVLHEPGLKNKLIENGLLRSEKFRWETAWKKTASVYRSLIES